MIPEATADAATKLCAVVFDMDGVLANTEDLYEEACEVILGRRGLLYDDALREQMMGRPDVEAIQVMIDTHELADSVDTLLVECRAALDAMMETSLAPMPGAAALIDQLRAAELPIAVATCAVPKHAEFVLTTLGFRQHFEFVLTSADVRRGKPDPEIYRLASERLGLHPRQFMVLEDSGNGCHAAATASAFTVAVPNRQSAKHGFPGSEIRGRIAGGSANSSGTGVAGMTPHMAGFAGTAGNADRYNWHDGRNLLIAPIVNGRFLRSTNHSCAALVESILLARSARSRRRNANDATPLAAICGDACRDDILQHGLPELLELPRL